MQNTDSFWAGVVASKGSTGRNELKVKSPRIPLLAAMQQRYGGYFYREKTRGILRYTGELRKVVEARVSAAQEQLDPIAWTQGILAATAKYDPLKELMTLPWVKKKGIYVQTRINQVLGQVFSGLSIITNDKGILTIPPPLAARVHAWVPVFPETVQPNNILSQRVLLAEVNTNRYNAGVPQRLPRLTEGQRDAILHEAPRLTYKQISSRQNASLTQIKRVTKVHGIRKKPENVPDDTKSKIANMALQGLPARYIRNSLKEVKDGKEVFPCTTSNIRRIGKAEWS